MRGSARRVVAAMFTLWFALYLGVPQAIHPCPTHSAKAGIRTAAAAQHHRAGDRTQHHAAGHSEQSKGKGHAEQCCCPGPQCGAGALTVALPRFAPASVVAQRAVTAPSAQQLTPVERPAYALPCSTAPPASVA
ncbi:MAG TPA: hypothetical protein VGQ52_21445 [Gemmatimonadaceae bacterium]|nr:hypothetical protein [Gemmatimonadaceae bacterium]